MSSDAPTVQAFDWARAAKWGLGGALGTAALIAGAPLLAGAAAAGGLAMGTLAALSTVGGVLVGGMAGRETLVITANGRYGINPANPFVLYSVDGAPSPAPRGLYVKGRRRLGGTDYTTWEPNVRFFHGPQKKNPTVEQVRHIMDTVESARQRDDETSWAVLGKNDCAGFATTLQALIVNDGQIGAYGNAVGEMWTHRYPPGAKCEYHAATVVAEDGVQVTLEGHVSKDIHAPQFHIREGQNGFMADNQAGSSIPLGRDGSSSKVPITAPGELIHGREQTYNAALEDREYVAGTSNLPVRRLQ